MAECHKVASPRSQGHASKARLAIRARPQAKIRRLPGVDAAGIRDGFGHARRGGIERGIIVLRGVKPGGLQKDLGVIVLVDAIGVVGVHGVGRGHGKVAAHQPLRFRTVNRAAVAKIVTAARPTHARQKVVAVVKGSVLLTKRGERNKTRVSRVAKLKIEPKEQAEFILK